MLIASGRQAAAGEASRKVANADIEAACLFHEITKHSSTSARSVPHYLDWNNRLIFVRESRGISAVKRDTAL
jgi:hypothetical protein